MAVRGVNSFDNDDAVEWAVAYREMGFSLAGSTIQIALEDFSNNRLSAGIAARAVAAVEAVAFTLGRGSPDAQRHFKDAAPADPAAAEALIDEAKDLLSAVAKASELSTRWADVGPQDHAAWIKALADLQNRVTGARPAQAAPEAAPEAAQAASVTRRPAPARDEVAEAILSLSQEVEGLRRDMNQNFASLVRQIEEMRR
ncbi:MAG: DUF4259 domain-containing protein [Pseudomonadota bacterium]